jgi:hypothetical protein
MSSRALQWPAARSSPPPFGRYRLPPSSGPATAILASVSAHGRCAQSQQGLRRRPGQPPRLHVSAGPARLSPARPGSARLGSGVPLTQRHGPSDIGHLAAARADRGGECLRRPPRTNLHTCPRAVRQGSALRPQQHGWPCRRAPARLPTQSMLRAQVSDYLLSELLKVPVPRHSPALLRLVHSCMGQLGPESVSTGARGSRHAQRCPAGPPLCPHPNAVRCLQCACHWCGSPRSPARRGSFSPPSCSHRPRSTCAGQQSIDAPCERRCPLLTAPAQDSHRRRVFAAAAHRSARSARAARRHQQASTPSACCCTVTATTSDILMRAGATRSCRSRCRRRHERARRRAVCAVPTRQRARCAGAGRRGCRTGPRGLLRRCVS